MDPPTVGHAHLAAPATGAHHADEGKESDPVPQPMDIDGQSHV